MSSHTTSIKCLFLESNYQSNLASSFSKLERNFGVHIKREKDGNMIAFSACPRYTVQVPHHQQCYVVDLLHQGSTHVHAWSTAVSTFPAVRTPAVLWVGPCDKHQWCCKMNQRTLLVELVCSSTIFTEMKLYPMHSWIKVSRFPIFWSCECFARIVSETPQWEPQCSCSRCIPACSIYHKHI